MTGQKILVVEDEQDILELIAFNLDRDGFRVVKARSGEEALATAKADLPALIVLDVMLPGINGLDVCRALRREAATQAVPIIMLTARDDDIDVVTGLEVGADDYITKPFSPKVLVARIRAVLRRDRRAEAVSETPTPLSIGIITIDPARHRITVDSKPVELTLTEYSLLYVLAERSGWVFSRSQLIDRLRDGHQVITDRAIDVQVANLRKKLAAAGQYIQTVRGVGYRFEVPA